LCGGSGFWGFTPDLRLICTRFTRGGSWFRHFDYDGNGTLEKVPLLHLFYTDLHLIHTRFAREGGWFRHGSGTLERVRRRAPFRPARAPCRPL
jgi:hypothetical protein